VPTFDIMKIRGSYAITVSLCLALACLYARAQAPLGYYNAISGLTGSALKTSLHNIIANGHNAIPWTSTWTAFASTDKKSNGKVWDIYSWVPSGPQPYEYTFVTGQCGQYNQEGDCFNREHIWPQSFFNQNMPMVTDLHALYPSDGHVNNKRSNFPFGVVSNSTDVFQQGSKLGSSNTYPSWSGMTFEPIDSLKGDIARSVLYFCTRYQGEDAGWGSWSMANGADLTQEAITILRNWHSFDPVNQKEVDRNNAVYLQQGNRNPYIDAPELVECIWGGSLLCSSVGVKDFEQINKPFAAFINDNHLYLSSEASNCAYRIISCTGAVLTQGNYNAPPDIISLNHGLYFVVISKPNQSYHVARFVKQ
jgi:endonuclease I